LVKRAITMPVQIKGIIDLCRRYSGDTETKIIDDFAMFTIDNLNRKYRKLLASTMRIVIQRNEVKNICQDMEQHIQQHIEVERNQMTIIEELSERVESIESVKKPLHQLEQINRETMKAKQELQMDKERLQQTVQELQEKVTRTQSHHVLQMSELRNMVKSLENSSKLRQSPVAMRGQSNDDEKAIDLEGVMISNLLPDAELDRKYNEQWNSGPFKRFHGNQVSYMVDKEIKKVLIYATDWSEYMNDKGIWISNPTFGELLERLRSTEIGWSGFKLCDNCKAPHKGNVCKQQIEFCRNNIRESFYELKDKRNKITHWDQETNNYLPRDLKKLLEYVWEKTLLIKGFKEIDKNYSCVSECDNDNLII